MENKKNNTIICVCLALIIIIFVVGVIFLGNKNNNQNLQDNENNSPKPEEVIKEVVTEESILELAKDTSLDINTNINKELLISAYHTDDMEIDISLVYDDSYLVDNNNHRVKVNNFDEKVVTIRVGEDDCALEEIDILILTTEGNIYTITHSEGMRRFNDSFYLNFKDMNNYNLKLKKLNNIPVLAITNIMADDIRGITCSGGRTIVYANDNNLYYYDTFEKIDKYIEKYIDPDVCSWDDYCGLLIYNDKTISQDGKNLIKDADGNNILYKEHYIDKDDNIYMISQNNDLIIETIKVEDLNVSYDIASKKLMDVKKENNRVIFTLSDNTNIEIELGE